MKCLWCGKDFYVTFRSTTTKYCSKECGRKFHNNKQKNERKKTERFCIGCGKKIKKRGYRYCGEECARAGTSKKRVEYYKKHSSTTAYIDICLNCQKEDCDGICDVILNLEE